MIHMSGLPAINMPPTIRESLNRGATLAISISGGKDSQALLYALSDQGLGSQAFAIHADLGRAEWEMSKAHCQKICDEVGIPLVVVSRPQGDLVQQIEDRQLKLKGTGKPHWPSSAARYCTSDQKRGQIDKYLRGYNYIVSAEGMRAAESNARSKYAVCEERTQICTAMRQAYNWRPLLNWTDTDVWETIGTSAKELAERQALYRAGDKAAALAGWPAHPAYVFGNQRVSCALCILASRADIVNGAKHNPALLASYVAMEKASGFAFRQDLRLSEL